eukprot:gene240-2887_t
MKYYTHMELLKTYSPGCDNPEAVEHAAEATEGALGFMFGDSIVVTWNAARRCRHYQKAALRFAALLHGRLREARSAAGVSVGVAAGELLHGA